MTSKKEFPYLHSEGRQIKPLRDLSPWPELEMHPETANKLDLKEGEWVFVETSPGRIKQKLRFNNSLDPRVVYVAYGWWFPEKGEAELYGWDESNLNCLTSSSPPYEMTLGSLTLRGIPCRVYKA
jgi:anaerobic selenocysteine-containing dehydrogenase